MPNNQFEKILGLRFLFNPMKKFLFIITWIGMGGSLLWSQTWDFNSGSIPSELTVSNGSVQTGNGSGTDGYFTGTALNFTGGGTRFVTLPVTNSASASGVLSWKMIYGTDSNGGEELDNTEHVALYYSTDGGTNFTKHTDFDDIATYKSTSWIAVTVNLTGDLAASSIIYKIQQVKHSGADYDHWGVDDVVLNNDPNISSSAIASDNSYIDVTMNEAVYNADGGSGALEATDFTLTFAQNSGSATDVSISSVKQNDNVAEGSASALAGGETVIRFFLTITGTPSGVETITITPVDATSIYDVAGNAMPSSQTTGAKTLND